MGLVYIFFLFHNCSWTLAHKLLAILSIIFIDIESSSFQVGISMWKNSPARNYGGGGHPPPLQNFNFLLYIHAINV